MSLSLLPSLVINNGRATYVLATLAVTAVMTVVWKFLNKAEALPPKPPITARIARQVFSEKKVPEDVDVVIIGSGIGGLAPA
eukprot:CAMPEP_0198224774 /NCGR_PEP_ID=MMETSP1445-20131203/98287_1 /TAXON_ID=36898 /ORGANISM="Pyramimonas sp., Strain CCMP2087" /LENGTH=81 /DNA_ID=CAMNT_0043904057 /DNA_START=186 /DNA_END=427 /DNA_ORIENTATION=+